MKIYKVNLTNGDSFNVISEIWLFGDFHNWIYFYENVDTSVKVSAVRVSEVANIEELPIEDCLFKG